MRSVIAHYPYYYQRFRSLPASILRSVTRYRCGGYVVFEPFLTDKKGLEIGGPSKLFRENGLIPIYDTCRSIDNCNFSERTIWSKRGDKESFGGRLGKQYVADASDLAVIPSASYDFLLASHVLEHIANPLKALQDWKRLLVDQGLMLVIVPDRRGTFDRRRPYTRFDHIWEDFRRDTPESDLTHLDEVLSLHDFGLDCPGCTWEEYSERCRQNFSFRGMHHHVFSPEVLAQMFDSLGMRVLNISIERPYHIIIGAQVAVSADREEVRP